MSQTTQPSAVASGTQTQLGLDRSFRSAAQIEQSIKTLVQEVGAQVTALVTNKFADRMRPSDGLKGFELPIPVADRDLQLSLNGSVLPQPEGAALSGTLKQLYVVNFDIVLRDTQTPSETRIACRNGELDMQITKIFIPALDTNLLRADLNDPAMISYKHQKRLFGPHIEQMLLLAREALGQEVARSAALSYQGVALPQVQA